MSREARMGPIVDGPWAGQTHSNVGRTLNVRFRVPGWNYPSEDRTVGHGFEYIWDQMERVWKLDTHSKKLWEAVQAHIKEEPQ